MRTLHVRKLAYTALLAAGLWLAGVAPSQASWSVSYSSGDYKRDHWGWHHKGRHHHHHRYHYPYNFVRLDYGPAAYYYADGYYYQGPPDNYVVVAPPPGIVIRTLPVGFQRFVVHGRVYYHYNNVYYARCHGGYQIVPSPYTETVPVASATGSYAPTSSASELTINVPNNRGGYTAVTLKRSGSGYVGPQSEYYNEFPTVDQLKIVYGGK